MMSGLFFGGRITALSLPRISMKVTRILDTVVSSRSPCSRLTVSRVFSNLVPASGRQEGEEKTLRHRDLSRTHSLCQGIFDFVYSHCCVQLSFLVGKRSGDFYYFQQAVRFHTGRLTWCGVSSVIALHWRASRFTEWVVCGNVGQPLL